MAKRGKSINLFLMDGEPNGKQMMEKRAIDSSPMK